MKNKLHLTGHMFNHQTGCLDTIENGIVTNSVPLMTPSPIKQKYVVGTAATLNLNYSSTPCKWESGKSLVVKK